MLVRKLVDVEHFKELHFVERLRKRGLEPLRMDWSIYLRIKTLTILEV